MPEVNQDAGDAQRMLGPLSMNAANALSAVYGCSECFVRRSRIQEATRHTGATSSEHVGFTATRPCATPEGGCPSPKGRRYITHRWLSFWMIFFVAVGVERFTAVTLTRPPPPPTPTHTHTHTHIHTHTHTHKDTQRERTHPHTRARGQHARVQARARAPAHPHVRRGTRPALVCGAGD